MSVFGRLRESDAQSLIRCLHYILTIALVLQSSCSCIYRSRCLQRTSGIFQPAPGSAIDVDAILNFITKVLESDVAAECHRHVQGLCRCGDIELQESCGTLRL